MKRKVKVLGFNESIRYLCERALKLRLSKGPVIIQIAGSSASGKTMLAVAVKDYIGGDAKIISMDDYYKGIEFIKQQKALGKNINFDQPEALNIALIKYHLQALKLGKSILKPKYSFKKMMPEGSEELHAGGIIILEGLFALIDELKDSGDFRVFVDISQHGRIIRRLLRDAQRDSRKPYDILKYTMDIVEPMYKKYVDPTRANADVIVENEYDPSIESTKAGLRETQVKFQVEPETVTPDALSRAGANLLSISKQKDTYYSTKYFDFGKRNEMLRTRLENGRRMLTYKGPNTKGANERPRFEIEIDAQIQNRLEKIYNRLLSVISKERAVYTLNGVTICIDNVTKTTGGREKRLGSFVEINFANEKQAKERIKDLKSALNMSKKEIKKPYIKM